MKTGAGRVAVGRHPTTLTPLREHTMDTSYLGTPEGARTMATESPTRPPISVGLDLSMTHTGIAIVYGNGAISTTSVTSTGKKTDTVLMKAARLRDLADTILVAVPADVQHVVVEGPSFGSTGAAAHDIAGLWWMVVDTLLAHHFPIVIVAPSTAKKYATSRGNASKDEVIATVVRRYPQADVLDNNEADAVVLAAIGARLAGHPLEGDLDEKRADAFATVTKAVTR